MNSYTLEKLYAHAEPCDKWPRDRVQALLDKHGKVEVTAIDVLDCEDIGDEDAIYQVCRMVGLETRKRFAERCAEGAIKAAMPTCDDPAWHKWAEGWLDGSDRSRESARADAAYAAYAAAYAASAATYAAGAASAAAYAAGAAYAAANAAAADAATYALRKYRGWLREEIKTKEIENDKQR